MRGNGDHQGKAGEDGLHGRGGAGGTGEPLSYAGILKDPNFLACQKKEREEEEERREKRSSREEQERREKNSREAEEKGKAAARRERRETQAGAAVPQEATPAALEARTAGAPLAEVVTHRAEETMAVEPMEAAATVVPPFEEKQVGPLAAEMGP